jgi:hypothetical protein
MHHRRYRAESHRYCGAFTRFLAAATAQRHNRTNGACGQHAPFEYTLEHVISPDMIIFLFFPRLFGGYQTPYMTQ